ncbi:MAG: protein kinase [Polyangiaceae bacterium]
MKLGALIGDRFRLEALAGQGAMGVVYRAVDQSTGATVALKVLSGTAGAESNVGRRFLQEAEVLASLEHDSIVRYIGHGVLPDAKPWLAMEWLIGESLSAKVKLAGALAVSPALALGAEVARALDAAHAKGIVHRDLKPSNLILLGGDPRKPKLLDFGIARVGLGSLTLAGDFLGTPGYIAPEQARADPSIDGRADLFALGCVLFYTLTGRPPFYGEDLPSVLLKLVLDEPTPIDEFRSDVPDDAAELLRSLLAKDRAGRPSNAGEVAAALTRLAAETASLAEAPRSQRAPQPEALGLTKSEHRLTCLVLARVNDASARRAADDAPPSSRAPELDALRRDLKALGGHLDVLVDGSAIVTFDSDPEGRAPSAREQAAQAARCAMLLHRARTRVAVVAGRVDAALDQPLARIIERAVSMTSTTSPGIRLDDVVAGLLDARFDVDSAGERHTLFGERLLASTGRTVLGQATPFVGRHEELALLLGRLERCIDEPRSSATLIVGAPGVGKSRLVAELLRRASDRDVDAWVSRGDPMRGGAPAALVRAALQIPEGEADAGAVDHVRAKVSSSSAIPSARSPWPSSSARSSA